MEQTIYLAQENRAIFLCENFGVCRQRTREVASTTAMSDDLGTLADPRARKLFPLIGNYGIIPTVFNSDDPNLIRCYCSRMVSGSLTFP